MTLTLEGAGILYAILQLNETIYQNGLHISRCGPNFGGPTLSTPYMDVVKSFICRATLSSNREKKNLIDYPMGTPEWSKKVTSPLLGCCFCPNKQHGAEAR